MVIDFCKTHGRLAQGVDQTQNTVDRLFFFRQGLGSNYRGRWTSMKVSPTPHNL